MLDGFGVLLGRACRHKPVRGFIFRRPVRLSRPPMRSGRGTKLLPRGPIGQTPADDKHTKPIHLLGRLQPMRPDPVRLEIFQHLLATVCEEAGALLQRTAISPNIRERRDYSCALFDAEARLVAQAAHIPVHLGSAGDSVKAVRESLDLAEGDVAILNDPYAGGTHLPDVTMVRPIFLGGTRPAFYVVNRAHHADVGGSVPGSMGVAGDLIAEGTVIPPVRFRTAEGYVPEVLTLLRANVRGPDERMVDFQAQDASLLLAERRLRALTAEQGLRATIDYCGHLMDYSEKMVSSVIARIPAGTYKASDVMEDDGFGNGPFRLSLALGKRSGRLVFDYRGSSPQAAGGINANRSVVMAASVYVLRCLCPGRLPTNEGLFRRIEVLTEKGTLLDPIPPAPVAGGNVETSQRLVDVGLRAVAPLFPDLIPAGSAGTMTNLTMGSPQFAFYETLPGGAGARSHSAGVSAVQTHMTNTRNTPTEEMELQYPLRVRRLTVRRGSGGGGRHRGGDGIVKEIEVLAPATVSLFAERHQEAPRGLARGSDGKPGRVRLRRGGRVRTLPAKSSHAAEVGDIITLETPGGGGWGKR